MRCEALDGAGLGGLPGRLEQRANANGHDSEAGILGQACMETVVNLLDDDGEFETGENQIEGNV